jgi:hypothetical protein
MRQMKAAKGLADADPSPTNPEVEAAVPRLEVEDELAHPHHWTSFYSCR